VIDRVGIRFADKFGPMERVVEGIVRCGINRLSRL
jgi:hypothetical protein